MDIPFLRDTTYYNVNHPFIEHTPLWNTYGTSNVIRPVHAI